MLIWMNCFKNTIILLILPEFHTSIQWILITFILCSPPLTPFTSIPKPSPPTTSYPLKRNTKIVFITQWVQIVLSIYTQMWGHLLEHGLPTKDHTPEENWLPSPSSYELSVTPQRGVVASHLLPPLSKGLWDTAESSSFDKRSWLWKKSYHIV